MFTLRSLEVSAEQMQSLAVPDAPQDISNAVLYSHLAGAPRGIHFCGLLWVVQISASLCILHSTTLRVHVWGFALRGAFIICRRK